MVDKPAKDILQFLESRIDTVPELEALLLFWKQRPTPMTVKQLASRRYIPRGVAGTVIRTLERRGFVAVTSDGTDYAYDPAWEPDDEFMSRVRHRCPG